MSMSIHEARLAIAETFIDLLEDLATDEDGEAPDIEDVLAPMVDDLLDALGLEVLSVDEDGLIQLTMRVPEPE